MPLPPSAFVQEMVQAFAVNDRMNQALLKQLDPLAWRANPAGRGTRTIAAIFAHVHNIRCKWIRLSAPHIKVPVRLDRQRCTQKQAATALAKSAALCCQLLEEALTPQSRVPRFVRDGWARPWHPGPAMLAYMITHEAHHRGQACMIAHQLGFRLPVAAGAGMWNWERLWKQSGGKALACGPNARS